MSRGWSDLLAVDATARLTLWVWRVVFAVIVIVTASLALRPESNLVDPPLSDDSFLAFTVARNVALGRGVTVDGTTPTNGFQPLFTFVTVPLFAATGGDRYFTIRLVFILHALVLAATARLVGGMAGALMPSRARTEILITAGAYASLLLVFTHHFNGLETGLLLLIYAAVGSVYLRSGLDDWRSNTILGLLLGLLVLTRIDAAVFVAALMLVRWVARPGPTVRQRLVGPALAAAAAAAVSLPWWAYNVIGFGHLMPSSGRSQAEWLVSGERLGVAASAAVQLASPLLYTGRFSAPWLDVARLCLLVAILVWGSRALGRYRASSGRQPDGWARAVELAAALLPALVILATYYILGSWATHFYSRYLAPALLISALVTSAVIIDVTRRHRALSVALPVALAVPLVATIALRHSGGLFLPNPHYHDQYGLVREHVPPEQVVGAFQSGVIGYFRENVVNLDGKLNPEALVHRDDLDAYARKKEIRWFCDWVNPPGDGWTLVARRGAFILFRRD